MKNKFAIIAILTLIAIGIFFIIMDVLKFDKISGYIISGLIYGFILNILYKKIKFN